MLRPQPTQSASSRSFTPGRSTAAFSGARVPPKLGSSSRGGNSDSTRAAWAIPPRGLHFDQRWLDLVPAFVADIGVDHDRGCNVAHWNLEERPVRIVDDVVTAGGAECSLFHFSGFTPERPRSVSNYRPRLAVEDVGGDARELFARYNAALLKAGWATTTAWPHPYAMFDNGVRIPDVGARALPGPGDDARLFGDPFRAQRSGSFFEWLREHGGDRSAP